MRAHACSARGNDLYRITNVHIQWVKIINIIIYVRILRAEGEPREACVTKKQRSINAKQFQIILLNKLQLYKQLGSIRPNVGCKSLIHVHFDIESHCARVQEKAFLS